MKTRHPARTLLAVAASVALVLGTSARSDEFAPDRFGIGATLVQPDSADYIEVRQCSPSGPANRAGLQVGDRVLELDGQSIKGWPFDRVIDYLITSEALPVRITVRRDRETVTVELVRMRFSDIAAANGARIDRTDLGYRFTPLKMRPQVNVGDIVPLDSLFTPACQPATLASDTRTTVVYFWATWCGACKQLMKDLRGVTTPHRLIAVNVDETCDDFQSALGKTDPPGDDLWASGWQGPLSQSLGVYHRGIPTAALLDAEGRLIRIATGTEPIKEMMKAGK